MPYSPKTFFFVKDTSPDMVESQCPENIRVFPYKKKYESHCCDHLWAFEMLKTAEITTG